MSSTSEVYGSSINKKKMSETHPLNPRSPYVAKCGADRLVFSYGTSFNLPFVIIRPFNNYGPKQHLEKLIQDLLLRFIEMKRLLSMEMVTQ